MYIMWKSTLKVEYRQLHSTLNQSFNKIEILQSVQSLYLYFLFTLSDIRKDHFVCYLYYYFFTFLENCRKYFQLLRVLVSSVSYSTFVSLIFFFHLAFWVRLRNKILYKFTNVNVGLSHV